MTVIPDEMMRRYGLPTFANYEQIVADGLLDSLEFAYIDYLNKTDYLTVKMVEGSLRTEDMADELYYREIARQEIAKIRGEEPEGAENQKTLEQRIAETEEKAETAVSYDEMQAAIMEGVNEV